MVAGVDNGHALGFSGWRQCLDDFWASEVIKLLQSVAAEGGA